MLPADDVKCDKKFVVHSRSSLSPKLLGSKENNLRISRIQLLRNQNSLKLKLRIVLKRTELVLLVVCVLSIEIAVLSHHWIYSIQLTLICYRNFTSETPGIEFLWCRDHYHRTRKGTRVCEVPRTKTLGRFFFCFCIVDAKFTMMIF